MAAAYERMGAGFYCYLYADNAAGQTLAAIDPSGCGFCSFPNGKPRLTSQKTGGTFSAEDGKILRSWSSLKPLRANEPIVFDLSAHISVSFGSRQQITAKLTCQGLTEEYELGEVQKMATGSYLQKAVRVEKMGPERGKYILDVEKCRQAAQANRERRKATAMQEMEVSKKTVTEADMQKHPQLRPIVSSTAQLQASVKAGEWSVEVAVPKSKLQATLSDSFPTLAMGDTLATNAHSRTIASLPTSNPDVLSALLKESGFDGNALPLSSAIKAASGRYRPEHGIHYKTARRRLKEIKPRDFDTYIRHDAPATSLVVVCCGAGWLPQWRRVEPSLELLNGELEAAGGSAEGGGSLGGGPHFILRKFDMSSSRLLRERYNISTLPMYLMFSGGRLAYASSTLNGYGTGKEDMVAQVRMTADSAGRGIFLPDDFRFGATDDQTVERFSATLSGTAPTLGRQ